jgi:hypothetical protein
MQQLVSNFSSTLPDSPHNEDPYRSLLDRTFKINLNKDYLPGVRIRERISEMKRRLMSHECVSSFPPIKL